MAQDTTTLDLPVSVRGRACYTQLLGVMAMEGDYLEEIISRVEQVGIERIWERNAKLGEYPEYTPAVYGLIDRLSLSGDVRIPAAFAKSENGKEAPADGETEARSGDEHSHGPPPYIDFGGTAIIPVAGPLSKAPTSLGHEFGGSSTVGMRKALKMALADPDVSRIMFHVDSPGGTVAGTGDLGDDIFRARQSKPIATYVEDLAASAGYWIASQTNTIYSSPHARLGSIGALRAVMDRSGQAEKAGIKVHVIASGKNKGIGVPGAPVTKDQLTVLQKDVDGAHDTFVSVVARGRNVDASKIESVADGSVFPAAEAKSKGLVDHLTTFDDALSHFASASRPPTAAAPKATVARPITAADATTGTAAVSPVVASVNDDGAAPQEPAGAPSEPPAESRSPEGRPSNTSPPPVHSESQMADEPVVQTEEERIKAEAQAATKAKPGEAGKGAPELQAYATRLEAAERMLEELRTKDQARETTAEAQVRSRIAATFDLSEADLAPIKGIEALESYEKTLKAVAAKSSGAGRLPRYSGPAAEIDGPAARAKALIAAEEGRQAWLQQMQSHTEVRTRGVN